MDQAHREKLSAFLSNLEDIPWLAHAHEQHSSAIVVEDIVVGWDDWNDQMLANWLPRSQDLEAMAQKSFGDAGLDLIFSQVSEAIERDLRTKLQAYYDGREAKTENQVIDADLGLWPELVERVVQDVSWAATEDLMGDCGLFTDLLVYYRQGRWPCSWDGTYPDGRAVVL